MSTEEYEASLQPRAGCAILAVPIVLVLVLVAGYGALFVAGGRGRPAEGEVARLAFAGCDDALPLVRERVEAMGLGDPRFEDTPEGFAVTARLPADPFAAAEIPATLAAPGRLVVRGGTGETAPVLATEADVTGAFVRIDFTVSARVGLQVTPEAERRLREHAEAHAGETVTLWLDGVRVSERFIGPTTTWDRMELIPAGEWADGVRKAAGWSLVLEHGPLPCTLAVSSGPG